MTTPSLSGVVGEVAIKVFKTSILVFKVRYPPTGERLFIEVMTSDRELEASREGSE